MGALPAERCSARSLAADEPMLGTASTVPSWLLLEHPGPWGRRPLLDARLGDGLGAELARRERSAGVRVLLIRRPGRTDGRSGAGVACFAIRSGPEPPWIERVALDRVRDALDLDLDALGRGERLGLEPHEAPLFAVCTHGRRDPCCAERGRPLAAALATAFADETWESTHVGGDRFAGNIVAFPHGLYFGRVAGTEAAGVVRAYTEGRIELARFRGRSCRPMDVQAAEHLLRAERGLDGIDDVAVERIEAPAGDEALVRFSTPDGRWDVRVRVGAAARARLTCHSATELAAPSYELLAIAPAG